MRIAVADLWHLGTVTAGCLASAGHDVIGLDEDAALVTRLRAGELPVAEPGLQEIVQAELASGRLRFSDSFAEAAGAEVVWVTYDTPVDDEDRADIEFVHTRALRLAEQMSEGAVLLVSSQMPVGSIARLEREIGGRVRVACSPENLRLGKALQVFRSPDRVVVGVRDAETRAILEGVWAPFAPRMEWMSVESAEMTKHAINSFLATSICFINEIATLCERTGADALEVERGLKSDLRIGPGSYLHAGGAFAGGTLARRMREVFPSLDGRTIAVLGLTYKPGTNTLRRSSAVEAAEYLHAEGAHVQAFDPQISELPESLRDVVQLAASVPEALNGADAMVVMTPWPEFWDMRAEWARGIAFAAARFLEATLRGQPGLQYFSIGRAL